VQQQQQEQQQEQQLGEPQQQQHGKKELQVETGYSWDCLMKTFDYRL